MNRYDLLKRLKDKIGQLVADGLDEDTIFAQLHINPQFANVSRSEVHSFYKHLQENIELEVKQERRVAELRFETDRIKKSCHNAKNFLVYGYDYYSFKKIANVWQSRFVMTNQREGIKVHDLFQDKSKPFKAEVSDFIIDVYTLGYPFLLFVADVKGPDDSYIHYLYLARFDPENEKLQMVHRIKLDAHFDPFYYKILVDSFNASKFALATEQRIKAYKLLDEQIQFGKVVENFNFRSRTFASYCNDCIYGLESRYDFDDDRYDFSEIKVKICDLERNKNETIELDSLPSNLSFVVQTYVYGYKFNNFEWVRDCLFASVKFQLTGDYGVAFADLQTLGWTVINFASSFVIDRIYFASGKDLLICTEESKTYKLPICKPDSLRNMAWLKLINLSKQAGVEDPYDEARQYLPLNSDIQPFVFTEE